MFAHETAQNTRTMQSGVSFQTIEYGDNYVRPVSESLHFLKLFYRENPKDRSSPFQMRISFDGANVRPNEKITERWAYNALIRRGTNLSIAIFEAPKTVVLGWIKTITIQGISEEESRKEHAWIVHRKGEQLETRYSVKLVDDKLSAEEEDFVAQNLIDIKAYYENDKPGEIRPVAVDKIITVPTMFWGTCDKCRGLGKVRGRACRICYGSGKTPI